MTHLEIDGGEGFLSTYPARGTLPCNLWFYPLVYARESNEYGNTRNEQQGSIL